MWHCNSLHGAPWSPHHEWDSKHHGFKKGVKPSPFTEWAGFQGPQITSLVVPTTDAWFCLVNTRQESCESDGSG